MLNKLKIGSRLMLLVAVLTVLLIGVAVLGAGGQRHASESLRTMYEDRVVASRYLTLTLDQVMRARTNIEHALRAPDPAARAAALAPNGAVIEREQRYWKTYMATGMTTDEALIARRASVELARLSEERQAVVDALLAGRPTRALEDRWLAASESYGAALRQLFAVQERTSSAEYQNNLARLLRLEYLQLGLVLLSLLVGLKMAWTIMRSITQPMSEAVTAARRIADGDLDAMLPDGGVDETGQLLHELKRMKQALRRMVIDNRDTLARMVAMTDAVPAAVFQCHVEPEVGAHYHFISPQVRDLLGVTVEEMRAEPGNAWRNVAPDFVEQMRPIIMQRMSSDSLDNIDFSAPLEWDGKRRWVRMHARVMNLRENGMVVWNGYFEDVTAQLASEQALRQAKDDAEAAARAKAAFLATMSHEIRTPMTAILGMSHLVLQTALTERQRNHVGQIERAGRHLLGIINDVLDYSKIEAGKMSAECVGFNLETILDNVAVLAAGKLEDSPLELLFDLPAGVPVELRGDPLRLEQVLINLAGNAIKFTEQGEVEVSVRVLERRDGAALLRFAVRDTGIGIDAAARARLFESFQQADTSTTRKFGGTGLGLAISKRLVEMMGGTIGVDSTPGSGSCFWFTLPLGVAGERAPSQVPQLSGTRALVVDDNARARALLASRLHDIGVVAVQADTAAQALALLAQANAAGQPFGYVLFDWGLVRAGGSGVVRALIERRPGGAAPMLIPLTGLTCETTHREVDDLGLYNMLAKPVMPSHLRALLTRAAAGNARPGERALPALAGGANQLAGARILLAEDNAVIRLVAVELLAGFGLVVDTAENGQVALSRVAQGCYDLVLMDMQMPLMNGLDATRAIRRDHGDALPIVAMTANVMAEDRARCLEAGMSDFLGKPIEPDQLYAVLLRWIGPRGQQPAGAPVQALPAAQPGLAAPPAIDGVDTRAGLRRVNGQLESYWRQLRAFIRDQGDTAQRLRAALAAGDHERARELLHTLRGVAGNIGARALPQLALQLERALRQGELAGVPALGAHIDAELARLLDVLRAAVPPAPQPAPPVVVDQALLARVCAQLAHLMAANDAAADDLYREHEPLLAGAFGDMGARIGAALEQFDFDQALQLLREAHDEHEQAFA